MQLICSTQLRQGPPHDLHDITVASKHAQHPCSVTTRGAKLFQSKLSAHGASVCGVPEANHILTKLTPVLKLLRSDVLLDCKVQRGWLKILPKGQDIYSLQNTQCNIAKSGLLRENHVG